MKFFEISSRNKRQYAHIQAFKESSISGYSDFHYAGCLDSRKSTSWFFFSQVEEPSCPKQSLIAPSTMEAEFVSCYEATFPALWLRNFIAGFRIIEFISKPVRIFCYNSATFSSLKTMKVRPHKSILILSFLWLEIKPETIYIH